MMNTLLWNRRILVRRRRSAVGCCSLPGRQTTVIGHPLDTVLLDLCRALIHLRPMYWATTQKATITSRPFMYTDVVSVDLTASKVASTWHRRFCFCEDEGSAPNLLLPPPIEVLPPLETTSCSAKLFGLLGASGLGWYRDPRFVEAKGAPMSGAKGMPRLLLSIFDFVEREDEERRARMAGCGRLRAASNP